jgi:hypothetical protein
MASATSTATKITESSDTVPEGYHRVRKTLSTASSIFSFLSPIKSKDSATKEYRVAVYDALEGKLWADTKENAESK